MSANSQPVRELELFSSCFAVCRVAPGEIPIAELTDLMEGMANRDCSPLNCLTFTSNEWSFILSEQQLENWLGSGRNLAGRLQVEAGWRALRFAGTLDFSLVGIIAELSHLLAKNQISLFVVSTFETDYVLIRQPDIDHACRVLHEGGYQVRTAAN